MLLQAVNSNACCGPISATSTVRGMAQRSKPRAATPRKPPEQWQLDDAARLKSIWDARKPADQATFGADHDIGGQAVVHQYLTGFIPLNTRAASKFALGLGVTVDDFSPILASEIAALASSIRPASPPPLPPDELKLLSLYRTVPETDRPTLIRLVQGLVGQAPKQAAADRRPPKKAVA